MNTVFGNLFRTPRAKDRSSHPLSDTDAAIDFAPSSPLKSSRKADARLYKPNKPIVSSRGGPIGQSLLINTQSEAQIAADLTGAGQS